MFSPEIIQNHLNAHRKSFGLSFVDPRPLWESNNITWNDVIIAGENHSCPVICDVVNKRADKPPVEVWRSYQGKNNVYCEISDLLLNVGRKDLHSDWTHRELKKKKEKTHPDIIAIRQYPDGYDTKLLNANARMNQYYISDHFKTTDHINHGALPDYASTVEDQNRFSLNPTDYQSCALKTTSLDHFCALVAVKSAQTLKSRGVDGHTIAKLLSQNFAQTGSVREYGQQKHASIIVGLVLKEIKECGTLPGLASEFRQLARPKIEKSYFSKRNPRL